MQQSRKSKVLYCAQCEGLHGDVCLHFALCSLIHTVFSI